MLFRTYGQAVLTVHERHSRLLLAVRPPGKAATPIALVLARLLGPCPPPGARRSPSTMGPSSLVTMNSMRWASRRSS